MTAFAPGATDPTAVMGRRILAYLIDIIIGLAITAALVLPVWNDVRQEQTFPSSEAATQFCDRFRDGGSNGLCINLNDKVYVVSSDDVGSLYGRIWLSGIGWVVLNAIVLQGLTGATVGKLITGLRVIRQDGRKAGFGWIALRTLLLQFVDALCCLIGLITSLTTKGHRRVGDMAAGTLVVKASAVGQPPYVPGLTVPDGAPPVYQGAGQPGWGTPPGQPQGWGAPQAPQQPQGWSAPPAAGTGWGAPTTPPPGGDAPTTVSSTPGADGPTWDEARNTYIQYDREQSSWVAWDDAAKEWKKI